MDDGADVVCMNVADRGPALAGCVQISPDKAVCQVRLNERWRHETTYFLPLTVLKMGANVDIGKKFEIWLNYLPPK